jgi:hypothetical protein
MQTTLQRKSIRTLPVVQEDHNGPGFCVTPVTGPVQITRYVGGERTGSVLQGLLHGPLKFHVDKQKIDRVESAVLFSLI